MKNVLLHIWTFPICLWGYVNRDQRIIQYGDGVVYTRRWWFRGFAHAAWPSILINHRPMQHDWALYAHENEHLKQQLRWGGIGFLTIYCTNFVFNWIKQVIQGRGFGWRQPYMDIHFEKQARLMEYAIAVETSRNR